MSAEILLFLSKMKVRFFVLNVSLTAYFKNRFICRGDARIDLVAGSII